MVEKVKKEVNTKIPNYVHLQIIHTANIKQEQKYENRNRNYDYNFNPYSCK